MATTVVYGSARPMGALADSLAAMKDRLDRLESGIITPQLGDSSIDNGYIAIYDETGTVRARVGQQADGTYVGGLSVNNPNPPAAPAAPTVTPVIAGFRVSGNGPTGGGSWPADFSHCNVYTRQTAALDPTEQFDTTTTLIGTLISADSTLIHAPVPAGSTWSVWLTAVNLSGKESPPSATATVSPNQVVGADILRGAIDALALADGAVTEAKLAVASISGTKIADDSIASPKIMAGAILADHLAVDAVSASKIAAGAVTARAILALAVTTDKIAANAVTAGQVQAGAITAAKLAADMVIATRIIAGNPTAARVEIHPTSGLQAFRPDGITRTFTLDSASGELTAIGTMRTATAGTRMELHPEGVLRYYGGASDYYAEIASVNDDIFFRARTASRAVDQGYLYLRGDSVYIAYGALNSLARSAVLCAPDVVEARSTIVGHRVERRFGKALDGTDPRYVFIQQDANGNQLGSYIHFVNKGIDAADGGQPTEQQIIWFNGNVGFLGSTGWGGAVYCSRYDTSFPAPIAASAFTVTSSITGKADIRPLARSDPDLLGTFRRARALRWRRKQPGDLIDPDAPELGVVPAQVLDRTRHRTRNYAIPDKVWRNLPDSHPDKWINDVIEGPEFDEFDQMGPIAEHLEGVAPELVRELPNGQKVINIGDLSAYLWEALRRLVELRDRETAARTGPYGGLAIGEVTVPPPPPHTGALLYVFAGQTWAVEPGGARRRL